MRYDVYYLRAHPYNIRKKTVENFCTDYTREHGHQKSADVIPQ